MTCNTFSAKRLIVPRNSVIYFGIAVARSFCVSDIFCKVTHAAPVRRGVGYRVAGIEVQSNTCTGTFLKSVVTGITSAAAQAPGV